MKTHRFTLPILGSLVIAMASCAGVQPHAAPPPRAKISAEWPQEIREAVQAGQVGPGFTREQVVAALGQPSYTTTALPDSTEVWVYKDTQPRAAYVFRSVGDAAREDPADSARVRVYFDRQGQVKTVDDAWWLAAWEARKARVAQGRR